MAIRMPYQDDEEVEQARLEVQAQWHVRPCTKCYRAMIRERIGYRGHELCKWCQARETDAAT